MPAPGGPLFLPAARTQQCRGQRVWSTDSTAIRMQHGFLYRVAVLDWYRRYVVAWERANTLATGFCLKGTLRHGQPQIFTTDQGVQFTCQAYTSRLEPAGIPIRWDGRVGRGTTSSSVAFGQGGGGLSPRLPDGRGRTARPRPLFPHLQPRTAAPSPGLPDPRVGLGRGFLKTLHPSLH